MNNEQVLSVRQQYGAYAGLSLTVLGLTAILLPGASASFCRFLGGADPILVVFGAAVTGWAALGVLRKQGGYEILRGRTTLRGMIVAAVLATVMGFAIVVADLLLRYPANINVPWPEALLFYPAIGFVAEIFFHVVPLALLMLLCSPLSRRWTEDRFGWIAIICVAALEPIFQVTFDRGPFDRLDAYTIIHVFVFALLQLWVFRRYDFFSMYGFRLWYYAYWHLLWGVLRLEWLF